MAISGMVKRQIIGQITANGASEVEITTPILEEDSVIVISLNTVGGTPDGHPFVTTKNTTTKTIGITAGAGDTSVYDVVVFS